MSVWNRAGRSDANKPRHIIIAISEDIRQAVSRDASEAYLVGAGLMVAAC